MPFPLWPYRLLSFGRRSEIDGAGYLRGLGWKVVGSGFRTRDGEVDLIAWDGDQLVFVEVKARHSAIPQDAVGHTKRQRVIRAARAYLLKYKLQESPYRFDILAITVESEGKPRFELFRDAFRETRNRGF